jgi:hypothetical protein
MEQAKGPFGGPFSFVRLVNIAPKFRVAHLSPVIDRRSFVVRHPRADISVRPGGVLQ